MKKYTPDELKAVLDAHKKWVLDQEGGSRADLRGADLSRADLSGAYLRRADLSRAYLKIHSLEVFTGLYDYQCWAFVSDAGVPWVRMGCLWHSLEEWDRIGIRKSNLKEFPDDGSEKCERRVRAFEFTRAAAMAQAEKFRVKNPAQATA